jgi:hypothetical protein
VKQKFIIPFEQDREKHTEAGKRGKYAGEFTAALEKSFYKKTKK